MSKRRIHNQAVHTYQYYLPVYDNKDLLHRTVCPHMRDMLATFYNRSGIIDTISVILDNGVFKFPFYDRNGVSKKIALREM